VNPRIIQLAEVAQQTATIVLLWPAIVVLVRMQWGTLLSKLLRGQPKKTAETFGPVAVELLATEYSKRNHIVTFVSAVVLFLSAVIKIWIAIKT
jgi:hypothetical protein